MIPRVTSNKTSLDSKDRSKQCSRFEHEFVSLQHKIRVTLVLLDQPIQLLQTQHSMSSRSTFHNFYKYHLIYFLHAQTKEHHSILLLPFIAIKGKLILEAALFYCCKKERQTQLGVKVSPCIVLGKPKPWFDAKFQFTLKMKVATDFRPTLQAYCSLVI